MNTQKTQLGSNKKVFAALGIILGFLFIGLFLLNAFSNEKVEAKSTQTVLLEEQIKTAQKDYEFGSQETVNVYRAYCRKWVNLAMLKTELAKSLNMPVAPNWDTANVDCEKTTVPSGF